MAENRRFTEIACLLVVRDVLAGGRYPKSAVADVERTIDSLCEQHSVRREDLPALDPIMEQQVRVYCMVRGGFIGRMAAEQPEGFYIDDRVGRRPYPKKEIYKAVAALATAAKEQGLDPSCLPQMPSFHNCGVF